MFVALESSMQSAGKLLCGHFWSVRLYRIFPHYLINGTIFEKKKLLNKNVCFDFQVFFFFHCHYSPLWAWPVEQYPSIFFLSVTNSLHHH
jgi:hypothetical protein